MSVVKGNDEVHFFYKKYYVESDAWDKNDVRKNAFSWVDLYNYAQSLNCIIKPGKYDYITVKKHCQFILTMFFYLKFNIIFM